MRINWALALGWGAFLGYQHEGLLEFVVIALLLAAIWLWFERKRVGVGRTTVFVGLALWCHVTMALAYWPAWLIRHFSN